VSVQGGEDVGAEPETDFGAKKKKKKKVREEESSLTFMAHSWRTHM
jgi:hypothetical protein